MEKILKNWFTKSEKNEAAPSNIIKLDCEGGEKDFFTGLLPETAIKIRDFVGEYHYNLEDFYLDVRRVFNLQRISIRGFHRNIGTFTGEKLV